MANGASVSSSITIRLELPARPRAVSELTGLIEAPAASSPRST